MPTFTGNVAKVTVEYNDGRRYELNLQTYGHIEFINGVPVMIKDNRSTSAPAVTDDVDLGYAIGSRWLKTDTGALYVCVDASDGAANWDQVNA